jgi:hypothetical protein
MEQISFISLQRKYMHSIEFQVLHQYHITFIRWYADNWKYSSRIICYIPFKQNITKRSYNFLDFVKTEELKATLFSHNWLVLIGLGLLLLVFLFFIFSVKYQIQRIRGYFGGMYYVVQDRPNFNSKIKFHKVLKILLYTLSKQTMTSKNHQNNIHKKTSQISYLTSYWLQMLFVMLIVPHLNP